jgi:hypothetical protein
MFFAKECWKVLNWNIRGFSGKDKWTPIVNTIKEKEVSLDHFGYGTECITQKPQVQVPMDTHLGSYCFKKLCRKVVVTLIRCLHETKGENMDISFIGQIFPRNFDSFAFQPTVGDQVLSFPFGIAMFLLAHLCLRITMHFMC